MLQHFLSCRVLTCSESFGHSTQLLNWYIFNQIRKYLACEGSAWSGSIIKFWQEVDIHWQFWSWIISSPLYFCYHEHRFVQRTSNLSSQKQFRLMYIEPWFIRLFTRGIVYLIAFYNWWDWHCLPTHNVVCQDYIHSATWYIAVSVFRNVNVDNVVDVLHIFLL